MKREKLNCPNCGAPIESTQCPYCGTVFYDFAFQIASEELRRQQMEAVAKSMGGKQE